MALDYKEIRKTIIDSVKLAVGSQLTQTTNPITQETYGTVFNARPNPELPMPDYPFAVLDILTVQDTDWYTSDLGWNENLQMWVYATSKTLQVQVSVYGKDSMQIAENLQTAYRRQDVLDVLAGGQIGLASVQQTQLLPELLQTDFLEAAFVQMTLRIMDSYADPSLESIERIILDGQLEPTKDGNPIDVHVDVSSPIYIP